MKNKHSDLRLRAFRDTLAKRWTDCWTCLNTTQSPACDSPEVECWRSVATEGAQALKPSRHQRQLAVRTPFKSRVRSERRQHQLHLRTGLPPSEGADPRAPGPAPCAHPTCSVSGVGSSGHFTQARGG